MASLTLGLVLLLVLGVWKSVAWYFSWPPSKP